MDAGTKVGDPEELQAIEEIFLPGRSTSLLIGSVKSNIGHSEPTSGLCSITKVIFRYHMCAKDLCKYCPCGLTMRNV